MTITIDLDIDIRSPPTRKSSMFFTWSMNDNSKSDYARHYKYACIRRNSMPEDDDGFLLDIMSPRPFAVARAEAESIARAQSIIRETAQALAMLDAQVRAKYTNTEVVPIQAPVHNRNTPTVFRSTISRNGRALSCVIQPKKNEVAQNNIAPNTNSILSFMRIVELPPVRPPMRLIHQQKRARVSYTETLRAPRTLPHVKIHG